MYRPHVDDPALADEIIVRLNRLCEDPEIRADLCRLIETRVECSAATFAHPSIQAQPVNPTKQMRSIEMGPEPAGTVGFLGVLNGLTGVIPEGRLKGFGYIAAVFDDDMKLERFCRTDHDRVTK